MEEEDHDELLQCTDDESLSESEDQCLPVDKYEELPKIIHQYTLHSLTEFVIVKVLLILSSTFLIILLPLYIEAVNVKSDVYSILYFIPLFTITLLSLGTYIIKLLCPKFITFNLFKLPMELFDLIKISILYVTSGMMIMYALDRKRVMCHLQDPIKGITLVFSLIYYFFFCKKLMGLQRIFSTTTIIVGLFISVDYGLCDEFRCRGYEREHRADDAGSWKWQIHSIWSGIYIFGLSLFAAYFTYLDRCLVPLKVLTENESSTAFLATVSKLVSHQTYDVQGETEAIAQNERNEKKSISSIHVTFWLHFCTLCLTFGLFWLDLIPQIGKAHDLRHFFDNSIDGIACLFSLPAILSKSHLACGNVAIFAWPFLIIYVTYVISSIRFLILSQSAVYTVATASASLPLVGIWWSLFQVTSVEKGLIKWSPSVTGELICALLGLPIVLIGLTLLCKSHCKDVRSSTMLPNLHVTAHLTNSFRGAHQSWTK